MNKPRYSVSRKLNKLHFCACGNPGTIKKWSTWGCARCIDLEKRYAQFQPKPTNPEAEEERQAA